MSPRCKAYFGQPGNQAKGCGFPVAHVLALFHAGTGLLLEVFAAPLRSHDMAGVGGILPPVEALAMCWWPTADSARSLIWRCSSARASMRYFACTRSRSSTSRRAVPMPGPVRSGHPRGCRAAAGCRPAA